MRLRKKIVNLTEPEKAQFEDYLEKKLVGLKPLLEAHHPDEDSVYMDARIKKHEKHTAFVFDCSLQIPRKNLVSSEIKHTITEALDFAMQKLEQRLTKHLKKLREPPRRQRSIRSMKVMETAEALA